MKLPRAVFSVCGSSVAVPDLWTFTTNTLIPSLGFILSRCCRGSEKWVRGCLRVCLVHRELPCAGEGSPLGRKGLRWILGLVSGDQIPVSSRNPPSVVSSSSLCFGGAAPRPWSHCGDLQPRRRCGFFWDTPVYFLKY